MLYLSGGHSLAIEKGAHEDVGWLMTPYNGWLPSSSVRPFAADNGCYTQGPLQVGTAPYRRLQAKLSRRTGCLFLPANDIVCDWRATLDAFHDGGEALVRGLGVPVAIVLQDGARVCDVPWSRIDAVFVGGSTEFKLSSGLLIRAAKRRGLWVHVGRVNTWTRISWAEQTGADSVDGTHLTFAPTRRLRQLNSWMQRLRLRRGLAIGDD